MATQKQQGIKKQLTKGFVKVAIIGAIAAVIGIVALQIAAMQYEKALSRYGFTQGDIGKAVAAFSESRSALRAVVGYDDKAVIDKQIELHDQKKEAFETYIDELNRSIKFTEGRDAYNKVLQELDGYWELDAQVLELATSDDEDGYLKAQDLDIGELTAQYERDIRGVCRLDESVRRKRRSGGGRFASYGAFYADRDSGYRSDLFLEFCGIRQENGRKYRRTDDSAGRSTSDFCTGRFE